MGYVHPAGTARTSVQDGNIRTYIDFFCLYLNSYLFYNIQKIFMDCTCVQVMKII